MCSNRQVLWHFLTTGQPNPNALTSTALITGPPRQDCVRVARPRMFRWTCLYKANLHNADDMRQNKMLGAFHSVQQLLSRWWMDCTRVFFLPSFWPHKELLHYRSIWPIHTYTHTHSHTYKELSEGIQTPMTHKHRAQVELGWVSFPRTCRHVDRRRTSAQWHSCPEAGLSGGGHSRFFWFENIVIVLPFWWFIFCFIYSENIYFL